MLLKPRLSLLLTLGLLGSGCTGLMPRMMIEDSEMAREGARMATLDTCVARGLASAGIVADYREAQARLLSVSSHNRDLFEQRYAVSRVEFSSQPEKAVSKVCRRVDSELPVATRAMQRRYAQLSGLKPGDLKPELAGLMAPAYQPKVGGSATGAAATVR